MPATVRAKMIFHAIRIGIVEANLFCWPGDRKIYPISIKPSAIVANE
jgi:hypothetical protein